MEKQHQVFRIFRLLEYKGNRAFMETSLMRRAVKGTHQVGNGYIKEALIGDWPELLAEGLTEEQLERRFGKGGS